MTLRHRIILLLVALPFSTGLALATFVLLEATWAVRIVAAVAVFAGSDLLFRYAAARIPARTGPETLPGREAEVVADFVEHHDGTRIGHVRLDGERWRARIALRGQPVPGPGNTVRVEGIEGLTLVVSPLPRQTPGRSR